RRAHHQSGKKHQNRRSPPHPPPAISAAPKARPPSASQRRRGAQCGLGVTDKTVKRHLKALRDQGWLKRVGSDKTGHWKVIEKTP
ncbi:MAG: hypothetical protein WD065_16730, partial [Planctomycetaceae bacterium]